MQEIIIPATVDNIPLVTKFVDMELEKRGCPLKTKYHIDIVLDELFGNIAQYAYPNGEGKVTIRMEYQETSNSLSITFIDQGIPYNPLEHNEPDISSAAEDREIGGLGIFLSKKLMDNMSYDRIDGNNILKIQKIL